MSHLDEGTLHAMLDGELSGDEVAEAQAHLEQCAQCRASLAEAKDFFSETDVLIESLDEPESPAPAAPAENAPAARAWYRRPRVLSLAATVALVIGVTFVAYRASPDMQPAFQRPASAEPDPVVLGEAESRTSKQNAPAPVGGVVPDSGAEADGGFRAGVAPTPAPERTITPALPPADADDAAPQPAAESLVTQEEIAAGKDDGDRKEQVDAPAAPAAPVESERDAVFEAVDELAREDKAGDSVAAKRARAAGNEFADMAAVPADEDAFAEMVKTLGGSIRLIDGKQAVRYEQVPVPELEGLVRGDLVRVVYQDDQDREFALEQLRLAEDEEQNRRQLEQAPAPAPALAIPPEAGAGGRVMALRSISPGDTVVSRESEGLVRIRWIDGDFVLSLVGADEAYLRSQMEHVR